MTMNVEKSTETKLTSFGIKNTFQRKRVLEILAGAGQPLTVDEIYLRSKQEADVVSLSTVYRIMELFAAKGLVLKNITFDEKKYFYELAATRHKHYLICASCKKKLGIDDCPVEQLERTLAGQTGYKIVGHKLDVYGYCPACQQAMAKTEGADSDGAAKTK